MQKNDAENKQVFRTCTIYKAGKQIFFFTVRMKQDQIFCALTDSCDYNLKLSSELDLSGEQPGFELGIIKFCYNLEYNNIYNGDISYFSFKSKKLKTVSLPAKYYESEQEFTEDFNKLFVEESKYYELQYTPNTYLLNCRTDGHHPPYIKLSRNLSAFMGMEQEITTQGVFKSKTVPDKSGGNRYIFIHCLEFENINVNSRNEPLLCILAFGAGQKTTFCYHYETDRIVYVPLIDTRINSLRLIVKNQFGDLFPFKQPSCLFNISCRPSLRAI